MTHHQAAADAGTSGKVLSRQMGAFLIELAIALHKHEIHPPTHPALARVVDRVPDRLEALLERRPSGPARRRPRREGGDC